MAAFHSSAAGVPVEYVNSLEELKVKLCDDISGVPPYPEVFVTVY
jgi:hypothetical protein